MGMNACDTFREIDALFIDYETNEDEFNNKDGSYNKYCPGRNGYQRCETNYEKLSAVSGYAYKELIQNKMVDLDSENDLSVDFLVMALSNILYKLSKDHSLSLKDAFNKHLKNQGSFNYSSILYNKNYFNGSNIGIMNGFYFLFQQICETINRYNESNAKTYEHTANIAQCYMIYDTLYKFVNHCGPYLQLLNHFKKIYDKFKNAVIKHNENDESLLNNLIELSPIDTIKFEYEFESPECKQVSKKLEQNISRIKNKSQGEQEEQEEQEEFNGLIELLGFDDDDDAEDGGDMQNSPQPPPPVLLLPQAQHQNIKIGSPSSQYQQDHQLSKLEDPSIKSGNELKDKPKDLDNTSTDTDTQDGSSIDTKTKQDNIDTPKSAKDNHYVFDLTILKEYGNLVITRIGEYRESIINSFNDIRTHLYDYTWPTLNQVYSNFSDYYKNLNIMEYFKKEADSTEEKKTEASENMPSSNENGSEPTSSLPEGKKPESQDNSTQTQDDQTNNHSKESNSIQKYDQTDSEPEKTSDITHGKQSQLSLDPSSKAHSLNIETGNPGINVKENTQLVNSIDISKGYKRPEVAITVLSIPIILLIVYKYLSYGWRKELKRKKNMKKVINSIGGKRPYSVFNKIDDYLRVENGRNVVISQKEILRYCPYSYVTYSNFCLNYLEKVSSGVINLLEMLKDKFDSKYDKLAEYAILLLSYKLNQYPEHKSTNLNDFYSKRIEKNKYYDNKIKDDGPTYKDIIDKKKRFDEYEY
ncbi:hypothetical protein YYE_04419 [Plasmodium vinckei vinckei]|uniref:PIR protein CIR protein n=1 Tax=Plasmodium vinckei vinckei TaxID=54757 RepID=A0A081IA82_PLAVN|nr:hypothetical protein YYE_04419 [Plasmodium vinckei vinckei]